MADIDGDGKVDILTPNGWFKNIDANQDQWEWHGEWNLERPGFPIIGYDVNNDGKIDLIYGRGHSYGLYWLEQQGVRDRAHMGQTHDRRIVFASACAAGWQTSMATARWNCWPASDIAGRGRRSRLLRSASVYYYKIDRKNGEFTRYPISVNGTAAAGTQFVVEDLDGDGDLDIATAGKTGVHFFENLRIDKVPKDQREKEMLLNKNWPFPGEGENVKWQH